MADIINLKSVRKQKARADKEAQAATNRAKFGRTKADKALEAAKAELNGKQIDAHKLDE